MSGMLSPPTMQEMQDFMIEHPLTIDDYFTSKGVVERFTLSRLQQVDGVEVFDHDAAKDWTAIAEHTVVHNLNGLQQGVALWRPRLLFDPLLSIEYIRLHAHELQLLIVGPRSEAEIFLAFASGFKPENIHTLDIMRYSALVCLGDMHEMPYTDDMFDVVIAGWVLAYSHDNQRAVDEMLRVLRPQGHIAIGCVAEPLSLLETSKQDIIERYSGGILMTENDPERPGETHTVSRYFHSSQIENLLGDALDTIIFREDTHPALRDQRANTMLIGRVQ